MAKVAITVAKEALTMNKVVKQNIKAAETKAKFVLKVIK